ncbi:DUF4268 domain-containing protein [Microbacterium sp.]|uniref:DUF4268 domain-containing protein n=1 Tax=Microbacterium sp. TaxID=51671 RepID=UPI0027374677|nr:DUF4268 domain-containing protein [Microbacterium sp.]MDP3950537.1 DUF4268 domain-containing protein [Microbacterium sp.]
MADELLFRVDGSTAVKAAPVTLGEAGLRERSDLQRWVIAHPEMIGPDILVVTFEFGRWVASGVNTADRLDVLGLDADGTLVVVELKRDRAPDSVDMQAIKYAAMASRFTLETLADEHARYLTNRGAPTTSEEALVALSRHAPELSSESLMTPRIVLMARDFPPSVTATCVWLNEMGLDFQLISFQAYKSEAQTLVTVSRLFPVRDVEDFTITPRQAEVRQATEARRKTRTVAAVQRLVDANAIPDGTELTLASNLGVNPELREQIDNWIAEQPDRRRATWANSVSAPLTWAADGSEYSPSGLACHVFGEATGLERSIQGTLWWADDDGHTLAEIAAGLLAGKASLYQEFWTVFLDMVSRDHPDWTSATVPRETNWMDMPGPTRGSRLGFSFPQGDRIRTEIYIDTGDRAENKEIFDHLHGKREAIEAAFGSELTWERLDDKRACRIAAYCPGSAANREKWEEYAAWLIRSGARLREAIANSSEA